MGDVTSYVPKDRRLVTYNSIVTLFVLSVLSCIIANAGACFKLWKNRHHLIERGYFGLVLQANISYLMFGVSYLLATVPIATFLSKEKAEEYADTVAYLANVIIYRLARHSLPAIHAFLVIYVYGMLADSAIFIKFKKLLCLITGFIWLLSSIIAVSVSLLNCSYTYNEYTWVYDYKCAEIYNKYNTRKLQWAVEYSRTLINIITFIVAALTVCTYGWKKIKVLSSAVENMLNVGFFLFLFYQVSYITSAISYDLPSQDLWVFLQMRIFDTIELLCFTASGIVVMLKSNSILTDPIELLNTGTGQPVIVVQSRPNSVESITSSKSRPCTVG